MFTNIPKIVFIADFAAQSLCSGILLTQSFPEPGISTYVRIRLLQDASESSLEGNRDSAQPEHTTHFTATTNGNGLSHHHASTQLRHDLPSYPLFSTNSSRLFPEWSVPEPVGVPHGANGFWGSSWSQQQDVPTPQGAQLQFLPNTLQLHAPVTDISHAQMADAQQKAAPLQDARASTTQPANVSPAAVSQQLQGPQPVTVQAAPLSSRDQCLALQQSHHLSTGQVSLPQPAASGALPHQPAAVAPADSSLPSSAAPDASQSAPTAMQESAATQQQQTPGPHPLQQQQQASSHDPWQQQQQQQQDPSCPQQQHSPSDQQPQQQISSQQQQQQQQQLWPPDQLQTQGAQQHQQLLQQLPAAVADAAADLEATTQQAAAGPSNQGSSGAAPNVGAYSQRELFLQNLEQAGDMSFEYVLNDGQRHNSIWSVIIPYST